jgi:hypothetical protein
MKPQNKSSVSEFLVTVTPASTPTAAARLASLLLLALLILFVLVFAALLVSLCDTKPSV